MNYTIKKLPNGDFKVDYNSSYNIPVHYIYID